MSFSQTYRKNKIIALTFYFLELVCDKFRNLKNYYYKECNKQSKPLIKKSGAPGPGMPLVRESQWHHFREMEFLQKNTTSMPSSSNYNVIYF